MTRKRLRFPLRKKMALLNVKNYLMSSEPMGLDIFKNNIDLMSRAIDEYIIVGGGRRCDDPFCNNAITAGNKSGLCRSCYKRKYYSDPKYQEAKKIATKKYRAKKKLEILSK